MFTNTLLGKFFIRNGENDKDQFLLQLSLAMQ